MRWLLILAFAFIGIVTYSQNVNFINAISVGGNGVLDDDSYTIAVDPDGFVYVAGYFSGTADFDPSTSAEEFTSNGGRDIFLAKYLDGELIWARQIGGPSDDYAYALALDYTNDVYITGSFNGTVDFDPDGSTDYELTSTGGNDVFVCKLTTDGVFVWAGNMGGGVGTFGAGNSIAVDNDLNVYTTGYFVGGPFDFDPDLTNSFTLSSLGSSDAFLLKLDSDGNFVWVNQMGSSGDDVGNDVAAFGYDYIVITGQFLNDCDFGGTTLTGSGAYVANLSADGSYNWVKKIGDVNTVGRSVGFDSEYNIYTAGEFYGTGDFDPADATTFNLTSFGDRDIFISKLNFQGEFIFAVNMGGTGTDYPLDMKISSTDLILTTGAFSSPANFNPDPATGSELLLNGGGGFISAINKTGAFFGATSVSNSSSIGRAITERAGKIFTTGNYLGTVDFDPTSNLAELTSSGGQDIFIQEVEFIPTNITIDLQPIDVYVCQGTTATFTTAASGTGIISYRWYILDSDGGPQIITDGGGYSGTHSATLTINTTGEFGEGYYICEISGAGANSEYSDYVELVINPREPFVNDVTICGSGAVTLIATGGVNGQYRWYTTPTGGSPISGAINGTYTTPVLTGITPYYVSINDGFCESKRVPINANISTCEPGPGLDWVTHMGPITISSFVKDGPGNTYMFGSFSLTRDFDPGPDVLNMTAFGGFDMFLMKLDPDGKLLWVKQMGGTLNDMGTLLRLDASGNIYAMGEFYGTADFDPSAAVFTMSSPTTSPVNKDISLAKYDNDGNFIWARKIGGIGNDYPGIYTFDTTGNIYITGGFQQTITVATPTPTVMTSAGGTDVFIVRLNPAGDFIWAKRLGGTTNLGFNGLSDYANGIAISGGSVLIAGRVDTTVDFDPGAGTHIETFLATSAFILKLTAADGLFEEVYLFRGTTADDNASAGRLAVDATGNMYVTGGYSGTVDFDPKAGTFNGTVPGPLSAPSFLVKLDPTGNLVWAKFFVPWINWISFADIILDGDGNIYSTGYLGANLDFDPGPLVYELGANSLFLNTFVLKLDNNANFKWATDLDRPLNVSSSANPSSLYRDASGDVFVAGVFNGTVDFDPRECITSISSTGQSAYFFKLSHDAANICIDQQPASVTICSGPTTTFQAVATGADGITYQWQKLDSGSGAFQNVSNGSGYSGATTSILSINTNGGIGAGTYRAIASAPNAVDKITDPAILSLGGAGPTPPSVVGDATCATSASLTLTASGGTDGNYLWYTLPGGSTPISGEVNSIFTTPVLTATTTYYVSITDGSCESAKIPVVATIDAGNSLPVAIDGSRCGAGTVTLTASGGADGQYRWYDLATGGTAITGETNHTFTTPSLSATTTYYVSLDAGGCETARVPVTATLTTGPAAPSVSNVAVCGSASVTLSASGGTNGEYRWYTVNTGGTPIAGEQDDTFTTPVHTATTIYYVAIDNGSCESPRSPATVDVQTIPASPTVTGTTRCNPSVVPLTASGATDGQYRWYTQATGGTAIAGEVNGMYSTPLLATTTDYYVSINTGTCESPRVLITASISDCTGNQPPVISTTSGSAPVQGSSTVNLIPLLSDPDDNLDLSTLRIIVQPSSGAVASIDAAGVLYVDYSGISFAGTDELTIEICDIAGSCVQQVITIEVKGDIVVYNAISPNGDGKNEILLIQFIDILEDTRENKVSIFNRWGDVVFEIENYNNTSNVFRGVTTGGKELTAGTYFYKIEFRSGRKTKTGYISLK